MNTQYIIEDDVVVVQMKQALRWAAYDILLMMKHTWIDYVFFKKKKRWIE